LTAKILPFRLPGKPPATHNTQHQKPVDPWAAFADPIAAKRMHDEKYGGIVRRSREREAARREAESARLPGGHGPKGVSHEQQHVAAAERPDGPSAARGATSPAWVACAPQSRDSDEPSPGPLAEPVHHQPHSRLFFDPYVQREAWPGLTPEERRRRLDALLGRLFAKLDGDLLP
jgi:hypothetical protein